MALNIEKELQRLLLIEHENVEDGVEGACESYNLEMSFYDTVANGNLEELINNNKQGSNGAVEVQNKKVKAGVLSLDPVTNLRYHMIIRVALISRFCIEAGLDIETSYTLSDIYIRLLDNAKSVVDIENIGSEMAVDYCKRMRDIKKKNVISKHIVLAIEFIREHIQENLTIDIIAEALSLNPSYLSKLFKQEMCVSISSYIREEKIKIAQNMLRHLNVSSLDIANYLGFSSQSHFIQVFKKQTGLTPEDYRRKNYHQTWMGSDN